MRAASALLSALALADLGALIAFVPTPSLLADLAAPHDWLARVGADGLAAELAGVGLWVAALWLAIGLGTAFATALPGVVGQIALRASGVLLPRAVRQLVAGAAGLGVLLTPLAAGAAPGRQPTPTVSPAWPTSSPLPAPLWPSAPAAHHQARPQHPAPRPHRPPNRAATTPQVVVAPGDTLWSIAAAHLPEDQRTPQRISAAWPRWYAANHRVVGADPSHIVAGQVLHPPAPPSRRTEPGS